MNAPHPWKEIAEKSLLVGLHGAGWLFSSTGGLLQIGGSQLHALAQRIAAARSK